MERKQETKAVKAALQAVGINARVGHGKGTAWGWLHVNIGECQQWGEHTHEGYGIGHDTCPRCKALRALSKEAERITQAVTGRHGEYGGRINIYTQNHWSDKKGTMAIMHDKTKADKLIAA